MCLALTLIHLLRLGRVQVCKVPELEGWQLYLVDWGYNTAEERRRAEENPRITLLSLDTLPQATGTAAAATA